MAVQGGGEPGNKGPKLKPKNDSPKTVWGFPSGAWGSASLVT